MTHEERNALATMIELGAVPELHIYQLNNTRTYRFFVCGTYVGTYAANNRLRTEPDPYRGEFLQVTRARHWAFALVRFLRGRDDTGAY